MDPQMVVRNCLEAFESGNPEKAASYIADDMKFTGVTPQPLGKKEFVSIQSGLIKGLPDWKFNPQEMQTQGNTVNLKVHITGTNTNALPQIMPDMPPIPVTGKRVSLPHETMHVTVQNDRITHVTIDPVPGGGVPGLLQQLGINMPH